MQTQRNVVSHALQRRHTLEALRSPQVDLSAPTACDADPMLVRAAMHHGEPLNHDCPVCAVSYTHLTLPTIYSV